MAKSNARIGAAIASALIPVRFDGNVLEVSKAGVVIETRDLGKQSAVERFFSHNDIIAHTNEGEGFVIAYQSRPIASFHGEVTADGKVVVTLEGKRDITFNAPVNGAQLRIDFDANEAPSSTEAKIAKRETDKLGTAMRRMAEKAGGKADGAKKKKKKAK